MPIQHGLRVPAVGTPAETGAFAKRVEAAGFDFMLTPDTPLLAGLWRDVYLHLHAAAMQTTTLGLGPGVTNPMTREPISTAGAIVTLDDASAGRARLVAGTGYSSAYIIGKKAAKLADMRAAIGLWKSLFSGRRTDLGALEVELGPNYAQLPVFMAASAPKALALAGEIADGVLIMVGSAPGTVAWALERVDEGAARAGRRPEDVKRFLVHTVSMDPDHGRALDSLRPCVAVMCGAGNAETLFGRAGLEVPVRPVDFEEPYPDLIHAVDWDEAIRLSRFVPDEAVEKMMVAGDADAVVERTRALLDLGLDGFWWRDEFSWTRPDALLADLENGVLARLR